MLSNPYYMGVVSYRGIHYEGRHQALIEPDVWLACQDILAAHHKGEKDRVHPHYLRGTVYCSACGGRLIYSEQKGNGGTYAYFWCVKRKTKLNDCARRAIRVERVEDAVADFYGQFQLRPEYATQLQSAVRDELASQHADAKRGLQRATKRKVQVEAERQKLLQAHYAGAIPQDLLAGEMQRLTRELKEADLEIAAAKSTNHEVETTLDAALKAATNCQGAYASAPDHIRKQINQGFFEKLFIGEDGGIARAVFTKPFQAIFGARQAVTNAVTDDVASPVDADAITIRDAISDRTRPGSVFRTTYDDTGAITQNGHLNTVGDRAQMTGGVNVLCVVGRVGLEPTAKGL